MDEQVVAGLVLGTSLTALIGVPALVRLRRQARDEGALAQNLARGAALPPSLHPVIDADRCIGSLACLKACPEGDILGIVDGAARLIHAGNCLGHGRCAASCPVDAIRLVSGTAVRGVDLPEVDGEFQSSRAGVHLVGELAGMGLVANAVEQGAQCAAALAAWASAHPHRAAAPGAGGKVDVAVVGAGPAGVSCALELRARGLSVRLLDRAPAGAPGGVLASHPRQRVVLSGPLSLPGVPALRRKEIGKAELSAWLSRALAQARLSVEPEMAVSGLTGGDGAFTLETPQGPVRARKVVLALGLGGASTLALLSALGVALRLPPGARSVLLGAGAPSKPRPGQRPSAWGEVAAAAGLAGLVALAALYAVGLEYYHLTGSQRLASPLHPTLRPSSSLGLGIGIAATAVMLTNFLYALRKRWRALAGLGSLSSWLEVHVVVGILSPLVIAFHAAFQSKNLVADFTFCALGVVVATGLIGRYFYSLVPGAGGQPVELADLLGQVARIEARVRPLLAGAGRSRLAALLAREAAAPARAPFAARLLRAPLEALSLRVRLLGALGAVPRAERAGVRTDLLRLHRLRTQAGLFDGIKRLMRLWRSLHASLAILLVVALTCHIAVAVYLGYGPAWLH